MDKFEKNISKLVEGFELPQTVCPDCKGEGYYVGAFGSRDCFECRGFGHVDESNKESSLK